MVALTIIVAFGAALFGAYLQRIWTPDPRPQIEALGAQLTKFQQRVETIEQERTELENFSLEMSLRQAASQNYILFVTNNSERVVNVETVSIEHNGMRLSKPIKPKPTDDWKIDKHSSKTLMWDPQPDPATQLRFSSVTPPQGVAIQMWFVLVCTIECKRKTVRGSQMVTVDFGNRSMTPFGP